MIATRPGPLLHRVVGHWDMQMFRCRSIAAVPLLLAPLLAASADAADVTPANLVLIQQGTMPIILTAPHGGREAIPGVPPREDKSKMEAFRKWGGFGAGGGDLNTGILAQGIAAEI